MIMTNNISEVMLMTTCASVPAHPWLYPILGCNTQEQIFFANYG